MKSNSIRARHAHEAIRSMHHDMNRSYAVEDKFKSSAGARKSVDLLRGKIYLKSISEHIKADPTIGRTNESIKHIMDYESLSKINRYRDFTMSELNMPQVIIDQVSKDATEPSKRSENSVSTDGERRKLGGKIGLSSLENTEIEIINQHEKSASKLLPAL